MNAEIFSEWLRRQGHTVIRTSSSYWYEASPRVYQAFPYHWVIEAEEGELLGLLRRQGAIGLRYSTPLESPLGCISYHAIYNKTSYTLETLDRRSRQNVRAGLKNCRIESIPLERLAKEGWLLESDTAGRQGRALGITERAWHQRYMAAADLPGFEAWGALVDNRLVASLLSFQMDDWCELISQQCHGEFLNARVNNALCFTVTQTMVNRTGIRGIFYTLQSLDAPPSVDDFKFRMGYVAEPLRQRVVFHPWLSSLARPLAHRALLGLIKRYPENRALAKAEGMMRFHIQGKRPLQEQNTPECLLDPKTKLSRALNPG
jgi:hypothetical protein